MSLLQAGSKETFEILQDVRCVSSLGSVFVLSGLFDEYSPATVAAKVKSSFRHAREAGLAPLQAQFRKQDQLAQTVHH